MLVAIMVDKRDRRAGGTDPTRAPHRTKLAVRMLDDLRRVACQFPCQVGQQTGERVAPIPMAL